MERRRSMRKSMTVNCQIGNLQLYTEAGDRGEKHSLTS